MAEGVAREFLEGFPLAAVHWLPPRASLANGRRGSDGRNFKPLRFWLHAFDKVFQRLLGIFKDGFIGLAVVWPFVCIINLKRSS